MTSFRPRNLELTTNPADTNVSGGPLTRFRLLDGFGRTDDVRAVVCIVVSLGSELALGVNQTPSGGPPPFGGFGAFTPRFRYGLLDAIATL